MVKLCAVVTLMGYAGIKSIDVIDMISMQFLPGDLCGYMTAVRIILAFVLILGIPAALFRFGLVEEALEA